LRLRAILSLDSARGAVIGLAGTGAGTCIALLVRRSLGLPAWSADPVLTIAMLSGVAAYLVSLGVFNYWWRWAIGSEAGSGGGSEAGSGAAVLPGRATPHGSEAARDRAEEGAEEEALPLRGWRRYFNVDTNHKIIGVQYFVTGLFFLPFGILLQLIARIHMADPHLGLLSSGSYESIISDHGILMMFIVVLPVFSGMMNYFVPLLIGAREMAFPRLNAFSFWLTPPAGLFVVLSLAAGGFDTGWTAYPPLSASFENPGMDFILVGVYLAGGSSILTAINVLATVFRMRAPGMSFFRMPVFIWSSLATSGLSLIFTPFIGVAFLMVLFERLLGMGFFNPAMGGQVLLYQYLFWFYSHPAVYIFVLIGLGLISDIIPVFSRKPLFNYRGVAISSPAIAAGGTIVFAHHMFASGMPGWMRVPFMVTTLLVAVPTGVKVFAWVATTWMAKMRLRTPLLFVFSAAMFFLLGGLTGVFLGIVPVDLYFHDTYWVVGHFHALFFGGFLLPVMAAIYYWFPKVTVGC